MMNRNVKTDDDHPSFIAFGELSVLVKQLRILGIDCIYEGGLALHSAITRAAEVSRILLVRKPVAETYRTKVIHLKGSDPDLLLVELTQKMPLRRYFSFLSRCLVCNRELIPLEKVKSDKPVHRDKKQMMDVKALVINGPDNKKTTVTVVIPESVSRRDLPLKYCLQCKRVYWKGSHVERMITKLNQLGIEL